MQITRHRATETVFSSNTKPYYLLFAAMCGVFLIIIPAATAIGQTRADRFPDYHDLIIATLIPTALFIFLSILVFVLGKIYKIYVSPAYLRCYNMYGMYSTVSWSEINDVHIMSTYGMSYIYLQTERQMTELTIPVWLNEMQKFDKLVREYTSDRHPLIQAMDEYEY